MRSARPASLAFILATIAIDAIGLGIIMPVLPDVVRRFVSGEAEVSRLFGYFVALYALMQFVSSPILGALSDKWGRRPVLLVSLLGAAVDYVFMAFAPTLPLLFVGRVISGISGASYTVASAYIADISNDENRAKNFGLIGAGFGIGFIAGPAIGGMLAKYGTIYPFLAAAGFNVLNFLFGYFILPESLPVESRRPLQKNALNPFAALRHVLRIPRVRLLLLAATLIYFAGHTHPTIWTLYTEHRYGWTAAEVGLSLAAVGILSALSQGLLTGVVVKRFGEYPVLVIGTFGEAVAFAAFGFATEGWMVYVILLVASIFWASQPVMQSIMSRDVPSNEQGQLQGTLMSIGSLTAILNPIAVTMLFSMTSDRTRGVYLPGSPYFFGSFLLATAAFIALCWGWRRSIALPQTARS